MAANLLLPLTRLVDDPLMNDHRPIATELRDSTKIAHDLAESNATQATSTLAALSKLVADVETLLQSIGTITADPETTPGATDSKTAAEPKSVLQQQLNTMKAQKSAILADDSKMKAEKYYERANYQRALFSGAPITYQLNPIEITRVANETTAELRKIEPVARALAEKSTQAFVTYNILKSVLYKKLEDILYSLALPKGITIAQTIPKPGSTLQISNSSAMASVATANAKTNNTASIASSPQSATQDSCKAQITAINNNIAQARLAIETLTKRLSAAEGILTTSNSANTAASNTPKASKTTSTETIQVKALKLTLELLKMIQAEMVSDKLEMEKLEAAIKKDFDDRNGGWKGFGKLLLANLMSKTPMASAAKKTASDAKITAEDEHNALAKFRPFRLGILTGKCFASLQQLNTIVDGVNNILAIQHLSTATPSTNVQPANAASLTAVPKSGTDIHIAIAETAAAAPAITRSFDNMQRATAATNATSATANVDSNANASQNAESKKSAMSLSSATK